MTGFGSAEGKVLGGRLSIEIRSVNHRYFNPQLKLPFELGGVEGPLRERLRQLLERGHVTVSARWIEAPQREAAVAVDLARARQLVAAAKELKKRLKLKGEVDLAFVARQPDVLNAHQDGSAPAQWSEVEPIAERAVQELLGMRAREGAALAAELGGRLGALEQAAGTIEQRAPGYTMKVDEFSGVGTYLLDADGHRRFGRFATGNFIYGFGALQRGGDWIFRAQQACQQVWSSPNSLTFLSDGRLQYDFREDRIVIKYLNPSRANQEQTMWLGNFDTLENPVHNGTQRVP